MKFFEWVLPSGWRKFLLNSPTARSFFFLNLFFAVTIVSISILIYTKRQKQTAQISDTVIREVSQQTRDRIFNYFDPVERQLRLIRQWGKAGILRVDYPPVLHLQLFPLIENTPAIFSLRIARERKLMYLIFREEAGWQVYWSGTEGRNRAGGVWRRLNRAGELRGEWTAEAPQSPEQETWFAGAVARADGELFWTEPYRLFPTDSSAITLSLSWKKEGQHYVAGASMLYREVLQLVQKNSLSDSSRVFIFSGQKVVLNLNAGTTPVNAGEKNARSLEDSRTNAEPIAQLALAKWSQAGFPTRPFRFTSRGTVWWAFLSRFGNDSPNGLAWVIPQRDLVADSPMQDYFPILLVLLGLWLATLLFTVTFLRREKRRRFLDVHRLSEKEILDLISQGESEQLEFKSTLRWNLKTGKPGKEIELASLKTVAAFMNTAGGTLLVGVNDEGGIVGIDSDQFPNHDKYLRHFGNIFNQHIGLEFAEFVDFAIRTVKGKEILVVHCRKSSKPVFLKHKGEEMFFIRNGPSSRQLTMSQMLKYLRKEKIEE